MAAFLNHISVLRGPAHRTWLLATRWHNEPENQRPWVRCSFQNIQASASEGLVSYTIFLWTQCFHQVSMNDMIESDVKLFQMISRLSWWWGLNSENMWGPGAWFNIISSPPRAAYMRQRIGSASVQIMVCRLFGAKPFSELMLVYCHSDS